ncbi:MAG TPA: HDIG domain-containing protein [Treponemataceae bacterium]|nr:HDIG domain-containing protein [Treponemataceae bacterium]
MNRKKKELTIFRPIHIILNRIRDKISLVILLGAAFALLILATYFSFLEVNGFRQLSLLDFEVGKVADRDISASREISFIDENATQIRREARQRLVTAVFRYNTTLSTSLIKDHASFIDFVEISLQESQNFDFFVLQLQQEYPGVIEKKQAEKLYKSPNRLDILNASRTVFKQIVNEGIADFPDEGMERFNQSEVEIIRVRNDRNERLEAPIKSLLTLDQIKAYVIKSLSILKRNANETDLQLALISPFLSENLVYQADESESKLEQAIRQVPPVLVVIHKGQRIIKRGFIISKENFQQLEALANSGIYIDLRQFSGTILFLGIVLLIALYLFSPSMSGKNLDFRDVIFLVVVFTINYLLILICSRFPRFALSLDLSLLIPAAMFAMLVSVIINVRISVQMVFILSLATLCASNFAIQPALFSLLSGLTGVAVMKITGKRIDLVKSACILAIINPFIIFVLQIIYPGSSVDLWSPLIGSSINGFMSGILVLGFLPILESAMNTSTSFRLMEFSDLNSPIMKKMLLTISGTYNHSIMVATLAESACREIGADPLIARVGAYYHDIGKMDQSEYFVENQSNYNKHLDLNPRLSATVLRSHVKQGIEKARQLRLPREVIDIISEHHGNSLIAYFYNEAKKTNEEVNPEDFTYPGTPPRTRESAVVMLADVVEAACRTLEKPSVPRLEKFIGELINNKIASHQLENSELTFREIGIITRTFVNILAGYYHSRIEYPNQKDPDFQDAKYKDTIAKGKKT